MKFFNCAKARYTQKDLTNDGIESDMRDVQAKINSILNASSRPTEILYLRFHRILNQQKWTD